jgi:signal peptidase I
MPTSEEALRQRIEARRKNQPAVGKQQEADSPGILIEMRGWADALFFAFLLALFIRMYVFELFMIPTGSMTPTLIGDEARNVCEYDWDGDGQLDIVVAVPHRPIQVHLRDKDGLFSTLLYLHNADDAVRQRFERQVQLSRGRRDMIMVNKFSYWFTPPERGDIVVFKVPDRPNPNNRSAHQPFDVTKPVYIKRAVGLPGETLTVQPVETPTRHAVGDPGRLTPDEFGGIEEIHHARAFLADGEPVLDYPFTRLQHFPPPAVPVPSEQQDPHVIEIPEDSVAMLGDNQTSSSDSRYWGPVPLSHVRGRAIIRYYPLRTIGLLNDDT